MNKSMKANRGESRFATLRLCLAVAIGTIIQITVSAADRSGTDTSLDVSEHLRYSIPTNAVEKPVPLTAEDAWCSKKSEFWVDGKKVGERRWQKTGQLSDERPMKDGQSHGVWRWCREDGKTLSEGSYKDGLLHGVSRGWDKNGKLWCERPYENGKKHGMEREWNSKGLLVWEYPWKEGQLHGIARYSRKNAEPQIPFIFMKPPKPLTYWINGKEISKSDYILACKTNATLPKIAADK